MSKEQARSKRGVVLTSLGWQRLQEVQLESESRENAGAPYTIEALSNHTGLDPATVSKVLNREVGVDRRTLSRFFRAFDLELNKSDYAKPEAISEKRQELITYQNQNWGEAPDVSLFYGRTQELTLLQQWIVGSRCRLITLFGIGGIGKTALSVRLAQKLVEQFEYVIWQSLRNAPPPLEMLATLVQFLSSGSETDLPKNVAKRINRLLDYLRASSCLLILDNVDAIFSGGDYAGSYLQGYEDYGELFLKIGEASHQSCLLLTSREKPREVATIEGNHLPVRSLEITGLTIPEVQEIFRIKGVVGGKDSDWEKLIVNYAGNPLYLKIIATTILDLFHGNISDFLAQGTAVFGDVRNLLDQQFERLAEVEKSLIYWLAINREAVDLTELKEDILSPITPSNLLEVLESLCRRSLIEKNASRFTLQPLVMEYVTMKFIEQVCQEITTVEVSLFQNHALMKATAPDYVRDAQIRLLLTPIINNLRLLLGNESQIEAQLAIILNKFRGKSPYFTGYVGGNTINLLGQLFPKISNQDFSNLTIWQANLQGCTLNQVNFTNCHFAKSVFTETFGIIFGLAFSHDDELLATGSIDGEICLWRWRDNQQLLHLQGHTNIVESLAFSRDRQKLASTSRVGNWQCRPHSQAVGCW
jgi:hypothetical protein